MSDESEKRADKQDIRMEHHEHKAAADKFVSDQNAFELAGRIGELAAGVKGLVAIMAGLKDAEHRRNKLLIAAAILVFGFGVVFLMQFQRSFDNQSSIRNSQRDIGHALQIIIAVTGCTDEMTEKQCHEQYSTKNADEGRRRVAAVACVVHVINEGGSELTAVQKCIPPEPPKKPA